MPKPANKKRRIMRALKLTEISAVDSPAQEGARMLLMKRNDEGDVAKTSGLCSVLTSSTDGHQHGVEVEFDSYDGKPRIYITSAKGPGEGDLHRHDVVRGEDGGFIVSENAGHTHELDKDAVAQSLLEAVLGKTVEEPGEGLSDGTSVAAIIAGTRTPAKTGKSADEFGTQPTLGVETMAEKDAGNLSADLKKRDEQIAILKAVIDLTPEHRVVYDSLPEGRREEFVTKSAIDRDAYVESIEKANPVVFTDASGTEYRKNDDARLIQMARERDEDREAMQKFRVEAEQATFEKKADEVLGLIPGERAEKIALVRAISKIDDKDTLEKVEALLEGANKVYKMAMTTHGVVDVSSPANSASLGAQQLLDSAIDACSKAEGITKGAATTKVLETTEGQRLYSAARAQRIAAQN